MDAFKAKATDFLVESLKLIVTISTLFFGALLAYGSNVINLVNESTYYIGLGSFAICAVLCIMNIHSLINKIYREEDDAIMQKEAKVLNVLATIALLIGLISSSIFITHNPINKKTIKDISNDNTVITDNEIIVGSNVKTLVSIEKNSSGKVVKVIVGEQ